MSPTRPAISLQQAVAEAPTLAHLSRLAAESAARLAVVRPLLPPALRPLVQAGAPEGEAWTLLAPHQAAAAKLRQLAPTLADGFAKRGVECGAVQVKVQAPEFQVQARLPAQKPLSGQAFRTLGDLRDALPDSELRRAVGTLLQRSAKRE